MELAQCEGRHAFTSLELAQQVRNKAPSHLRRTVYQCNFCRNWHIGVAIK